MGMIIEFISADRVALAALFSAGEDRFEKLARYPIADFSLHLQIPEDMDSLSRALNKRNPAIPLVFREALIEQIWHDGQIDSLTVIAEGFVSAVAAMADSEIKKAAIEWAEPFSYGQPVDQTAAYRAVMELRRVAQDAAVHRNSLILHLFGDPRF